MADLTIRERIDALVDQLGEQVALDALEDEALAQRAYELAGCFEETG